MFNALALVAVSHALVGSLGDGAATELRYTGQLIQVSRDGDNAPVRQFDLYTLVSPTDENATRLAYLVDERGSGGGWSWPERFGGIKLDSKLQPAAAERIRLLHLFKENLYPVEVRLPVFEFFDRLEPNASWVSGRFEYKVQDKEKVGERDCWKVEVTNNFGPAQTLWIDRQSPLLVSAEQRITLGRGDQFRLKMQLEESRAIDEDRLKSVTAPLDLLLSLQEKLKRGKDVTRPELSDEQLKQAADVVEKIKAASKSTPFAKLASYIGRDVESQQQRHEDVTTLAKRFLGKKAPKLELVSFDGKPIDSKEHQGKITVLHFWKYDDEPLVEPYGQVGYLDFLHSKRGKLGVKVYGVVVDEQLADKVQAPRVRGSVRKLKEFMNLGYPIAADAGPLLRDFGDPRRLGRKLPLWVVIGADGKIAHYHAGLYNVKPDQGLSELDEAVVAQLRKQRAAESE